MWPFKKKQEYKFCLECGIKLEEVLVRSSSYPDEQIVFTQCPNWDGVYAGEGKPQHYREVVKWIPYTGNFDPYTGKKNGS